MNVLILGGNGQVGWELRRSLSPLGEVIYPDRASLNLENLTDLQSNIRLHRPDIIVNAAAYTAVDTAESEPEKAHHLNAEVVAHLAQETKRLGAWLVHYSTDYVFDGLKSGSYTETDSPSPLNVYGQTKLAGERAIQESGCKSLIFRTSWVYAARGKNFIKTMLSLARREKELRVVVDQVGTPTGAELIADVTGAILQKILSCPQERQYSGIYHLTAGGETSWHAYAQFVLRQALLLGEELKILPEKITPVPTAAYPTPARRPLNSTLCTDKLTTTFGLKMPAWELGVAKTVREILSPLQESPI